MTGQKLKSVERVKSELSEVCQLSKAVINLHVVSTKVDRTYIFFRKTKNLVFTCSELQLFTCSLVVITACVIL